MKAADVRQMTPDQLDDKLGELKKEQFNLRFQRSTGSSRTRRAYASCAATSPASRPSRHQKRAGAPMPAKEGGRAEGKTNKTKKPAKGKK